MARPKSTAPAAPTGSAPALKATKQETLRKLASKRVSNAIRAIRLVGNLGAYKPTEAQAASILRALGEAAQDCKARLAGGVQQAGFSLPE